MKKYLLVIISIWYAQLLTGQVRDYPIIDVHNHSSSFTLKYGICPFSGRLGVTDEDGELVCQDTLVPASNGNELMEESIRYFEKHNIFSIVMTQDFAQTEKWLKRSNRVLPGIQTGIKDFKKNEVRELVEAGKVMLIGEVSTQYEGIPANSKQLNEIWELSIQHDIPVGIHLAGPGAPRKDFMTTYGNPSLLEPVLKRYPGVRVYIMHGGWPYLEETVSILRQYPNVYLDISWISWQMPRELYYEYLRKLILYGFEKRIMFGTDQVSWPKTIEIAVQGIEEAEFLSPNQKKNIFYSNALRFFRLREEKFKE